MEQERYRMGVTSVAGTTQDGCHKWSRNDKGWVTLVEQDHTGWVSLVMQERHRMGVTSVAATTQGSGH